MIGEIEVNTMAKFTKEQAAAIIAESRKHLAAHRAEKSRKKQALLLQKRKMVQRRSIQQSQPISPTKSTIPPTFGASEFDRDVLVGVVAELKGMIRKVELQVAELRGANSILVAEHRATIRESRHAARTDQTTNDFEQPHLREIN
jgi:hypothetical protein